MSSGLLSKLWDKVNPHFVLKLKGGSFRPAKISDDGIELRLLDGLYRTEWMNSDATFAFLRLYQSQSGADINATPIIKSLSLSQRVYLQHLFRVLDASNSVQYIPLWMNGAGSPSADQTLKMLTEVSECITLVKDVSIDNIVRHLCTKNVFNADLLDNPEILRVAYRAAFVVVGALTMLYTTVEVKSNILMPGLQVVIGNQSENPSQSQALRALSEFLRLFEHVLPQNSPTTMHIESLPGFNVTEGIVFTANMSLATICLIAKLELQWVYCIGEHLTLDLDAEQHKLNVFALPSFCNVSTTDASPLARISESFYEEWMKPRGMCGSKYVQEVLHTLLILLGTEKSRKIFKRKEIAHIKSLNFAYDPTFKQLYDALRQKKVTLKDSYNKSSDFPILAHRLEIIEEYVNNQQPSRLVGLWRDDRDIMRWYTLWSVIGLGIFASVLTIFQVGIGIFQAVYAKKAYDYEVEPSGSSSEK